MKNPFYFFLIAIAILMSSCVSQKRPYTNELQKQFKFTEADLKKVQFYTSDDIILDKKNSSGGNSLGTEDGDLVIRTESTETSVVIKKGTPGILEKMMGSEKLAIRFESGDAKYLIFGGQGNYKGQYKILAEEWKDKKGKINYANDIYYATQESGAATLLVVLKKFKKYKREMRTASGMKVN